MASRIINASSTQMSHIRNYTIDLIVTSPPYNVGQEYEINQTFEEWFLLCQKVFTECHRVLVRGGRIAVNVAGTGRKPYLPLHHYLRTLLSQIGFLMRGEIIWNKAASVGTSTAWGSWRSASNPVLRDMHEYILVFSKETMQKKRTGADTVSREDFLTLTKSIWEFSTVKASAIRHPCPFPVELPRRLIELYSFLGNTVLDPFCGSGQTGIACMQTGRNFIGYDIVPEYCALTERRIEEALEHDCAMTQVS